MDRIGFDNIDKEFKREVEKDNKEIERRWKTKYANKVYLGTEEMQRAARAQDERDRISQTLKEQQERKLIREKLHFGERGREGVLRSVEKEEIAARDKIKDKAKKDFNKAANHPPSPDGGSSNGGNSGSPNNNGNSGNGSNPGGLGTKPDEKDAKLQGSKKTFNKSAFLNQKKLSKAQHLSAGREIDKTKVEKRAESRTSTPQPKKTKADRISAGRNVKSEALSSKRKNADSRGNSSTPAKKQAAPSNDNSKAARISSGRNSSSRGGDRSSQSSRSQQQSHSQD